MSIVDWEWLVELPFGAVLFADPSPGMKTLPSQIGQGDLDGDLYCVCWDKTVLSCISATPIQETLQPVESEAAAIPAGKAWFVHGQIQMTKNVLDAAPLGALCGKLYKLSETLGKERGVADPDAVAYANAYKQVLDYPKHRRPIVLASYLVDKIRNAFTSSCELRMRVVGTRQLPQRPKRTTTT